MPYVTDRRVLDADAHIMETAGWLASYIDPAAAPDLVPMHLGDADYAELIDSSETRLAERQGDPDELAAAQAGIMTMARKGWPAYGANDAAERSAALDELGFALQVIYPTGAFPQIVASPLAIQEAACIAMSRGLAEWCADDPRLLATAYLPLHLGVDVAVRVLDDAIARDIPVVLVDMIPADGAKAPSHPDHDVLWARMVEHDIVLSVHVGLDNGWRPVRPGFFDNGRDLAHFRSDAPGDALSYMAIGYPAELFLSSMVLDGVLERFPGLRLSVAELGAAWLPGFLQTLDQAHRAFRRLQDLSHLTMAPSDYLRRQVKVTPFAGENVGWMMAASSPELYTFSSDYPHHEGSDDPVRRFDATLIETPAADREAFYFGNLATLLGPRFAHLTASKK